jgi:hypothetical protein
MFTIFALFGLVALDAPVLAAANELKAEKVDQGPVIDGKPDKIWNKVRPFKIKLSEGEHPKEVTASIKAMYTDTDVYFLIRWKDPTESYNLVYEFDGTQWIKRKGNEDKLGMMWNINDSIKDFNAKGCSILCHEEGKYMKTSAPGEKGDVWHWKAQNSNPVGYADDHLLLDVLRKVGHHETGRINDKKKGGSYSSNWDAAAKRPKYTFKDNSKSGPILTKAEAVVITENTTFTKGFILPQEVLAKPGGSRGDIEAKGIWRKGSWTLEMKRALNTGRDDDVQFDPSKVYYFGMSIFDNAHVQFDPSKVYYFGMSIFDNAHDKEHATTTNTTNKLIFK